MLTSGSTTLGGWRIEVSSDCTVPLPVWKTEAIPVLEKVIQGSTVIHGRFIQQPNCQVCLAAEATWKRDHYESDAERVKKQLLRAARSTYRYIHDVCLLEVSEQRDFSTPEARENYRADRKNESDCLQAVIASMEGKAGSLPADLVEKWIGSPADPFREAAIARLEKAKEVENERYWNELKTVQQRMLDDHNARLQMINEELEKLRREA